VKVKGNPVKLDETTKEKIRAGIPLILKRYEELQTGRTAGVTSGAGVKDIVEAIVKNTHKVFREAAVLTGEYGQTNLCMGVPVILGSSGIQEIIEIELAPDEKPYMEGTLKVLKEATQQVDEFVKSN
jgi:malate dehydrogenase